MIGARQDCSAYVWYFVYNTLISAAAPLVRWRIARDPRHRPLLGRFAPELPEFPGPPLWMHACSVGEVNTCLPLIALIAKTCPDLPMFLTASTVTGEALARQKAGVPVVWCPFDTRGAVRAFLDAARPRGLVLIETEIWPNLLRESHRRGIPILLLNGRLSQKHHARYLRFLRPCFAFLTAAAMQDARHGERIVRLGMSSDRVEITGNMKYDSLETEVPAERRRRLRRQCGIPESAPVVVFGSTRPGDESLAAQCWQRLAQAHPEARLVVAPRHPQRVAEILPVFGGAAALLSELRAGRIAAGERVLIVDTLGELVEFYAIADVAVVGGSFFPGVEGHNPLEPAALGIPVLFGAHMANFAEPAQALLETEGARQLGHPDELIEAVLSLLADPGACRRMGTLARKTVLAGQGATDRVFDFMRKYVDLG